MGGKWIKVFLPDDIDITKPDDPDARPTWEIIARKNTAPDMQAMHDTKLEVWEPRYTNVLNHGFIGLKDFMGDDEAIVHSARVSYGKGTKKVREDRGLLRYLFRHRHTTPIEAIELLFHVKAPIFVFRQWHRHRTATVNEYSGRYSVLDSDFYVPDIEQCLPQAKDNKQGRGGDLEMHDAQACQAAMEQIYDDAYQTYLYLLSETKVLPDNTEFRRKGVEQAALAAVMKLRNENRPGWENPNEEQINEKIREYMEANNLYVTTDNFPGLAREIARIVVPVAVYSQMYWKVNLKNAFHFMALRMDPHAQYEIRAYANAMYELIKPIVPWACEAFIDYDLESSTFSRMEMEVLRSLFQDYSGPSSETIRTLLEGQGLKGNEIAEFMKKVGYANQ